MKIVLLKDVSGLGQKGSIVDVNKGYANNFLILKKLGTLATPNSIKKANEEKARNDAERKIHNDLLEKNLKALDGERIIIKEKANEKGHLFAKVHKEEILKALKEQKHIEIPADIVELENPIKEVGEHKIKAGGKEFIVEIIALEE